MRLCCTNPKIELDVEEEAWSDPGRVDVLLSKSTWRCRNCGFSKAAQSEYRRGPDTPKSD